MAKHEKIWNAIAKLHQTQDQQAKQILRMTTVNLRLRVSDLEDMVEKLQMQAANATQEDSGLLALIRSVERDVRELKDQIKRLEDGPAEHQIRTLSEEKVWKEIWKLKQVGDKPNVSDIGAAQAAHDKQELDRLANYIRSELPDGTAGMGENVTDVAIRLLKRYRAALEEIKDGLGAASEDRMRRPLTQAYVIARDVLKGKNNE